MQAGTPIRFDIQAGIGISSLYGGDIGAMPKTAYTFGVDLHGPLSKDWFWQTGLGLTAKGCKTNQENGSLESMELNAVYADIPVRLAHRIAIGEGSCWLVAAGPFVSLGVGGKSHRYSITPSGTSDLSVDTFSKEWGLRRFDYGVSAKAVLEIDGILTGAETKVGLNPIHPSHRARNVCVLFFIGIRL